MERFTAEQARAITNGTRLPHFERYMGAIYKQIELRAKNGFNSYVCKSLYFPTKMKRVVDTLKEDGYKVQYNCMEDEMIVYW